MSFFDKVEEPEATIVPTSNKASDELQDLLKRVAKDSNGGFKLLTDDEVKVRAEEEQRKRSAIQGLNILAGVFGVFFLILSVAGTCSSIKTSSYDAVTQNNQPLTYSDGTPIRSGSTYRCISNCR